MDSWGLAMTLIVRLYDAAAVGDADRAAAMATATAILQASGIPTSWPACVPAPMATAAAPRVATNRPAAACDRPLLPGELAIRLVRGATRPSVKGTLPLGYSVIDPRQQRGALATIYLDRVEWIAADAGVDTGVVLGRAIAHEIGHLLLGTTAHAPRGLMRERWTRQAFERNDGADWQFSAREATSLRRAMLPPLVARAEE